MQKILLEFLFGLHLSSSNKMDILTASSLPVCEHFLIYLVINLSQQHFVVFCATIAGIFCILIFNFLDAILSVLFKVLSSSSLEQICGTRTEFSMLTLCPKTLLNLPILVFCLFLDSIGVSA